MQRWWFSVLVAIFSSFLPGPVRAAVGPDLLIVPGYIHFVPQDLVSGQRVRLYARVRNQGDTDAVAQVLFYVGSSLIGSSQPVSVLADGGFDDVYIDALVPDGPFNVAVRVGGSDPAETNTSNNEVLTPHFTPAPDEDRDGVPTADDNCSGNPNTRQDDRDGDGVGDVCDSVDDRVSVTPEVVIDPPPVSSPTPTPAPIPASTSPQNAAAPIVSPASSTPPASASAGDLASSSSEPSSFASLFSTTSQLSPQARFSYVRNDWRTVTFSVVQHSGEQAPAAVAWDFGDGTTSARTEVTHTFSGVGEYRVVLAVTDAYGNITTDEEVLSLSAFHLSNPLVALLVLLLFGLFLFSSLYALRVRNALRRGL